MKYLKVKDFAKVITGGTPSTTKNEYWDGGTIPWLNSGELNQDIITLTKNYITKQGLENSSTKLMPSDSVLIALTGSTTGVVGYLTFEACANQSVTGILPSEIHNSKYLYYYLKSLRKKIISDAYGGAQPHISQNYVKEIQIPLPPLPQQQKIANILDAADAVRQNDKALIAKYDELTQALFLDMFGDPVKNLKNFKLVKLSEIVRKDKIITYGIVQAGENVENGVPYIRTGDIKNGKIVIKNLMKTSFEIANSYERSKCNQGDIVMSIRATVGTIAIVPPELDGVNLTQGTARISPNTEIVDRDYLFHCIKSNGVQLKIEKQTKGATFREITLGRLRDIEIPIPSLELQNQFAERVAVIEEQKAIAQKQLEKSEELFNSLLQKAFKGELV